jgi:hypothetical protein
VASYFCTPEGQVLHAVAGPVKAPALLREARWAVETHKLAQLDARGDPRRLRAFFHQAHAQRLLREHGVDLTDEDLVLRRDLTAPGKVHLLLAAAPLARLERVYRLVFERVLGEEVSTAPVTEKP